MWTCDTIAQNNNGFPPPMLAHVWKVSDNIWHPKKAKTLKQKTQKSKCIQKHGPGIFLVRIRGAGENILNRLASLCCAHSPCISSLSTTFSSISLYNMSSVVHHLLFEDNDLSGSLLISFSPFYLFHLSSSLFYSHPAMNQDLHTALSPECVWEQNTPPI